MLLNVRHLSKSYGHLPILSDLTFAINAGERVGVVGMNGIGKSTLLRVLDGQEAPESGSIQFGPSVEVGYLPQTTPAFFGQSIEDLLLEAVGNLRQLEAQMAQAAPEELPALLEDYSQAATRFQERGGYELEHHRTRSGSAPLLSGRGMAPSY
jgi:ATPase subunit of ABC transporter with duplicated ATPase domains